MSFLKDLYDGEIRPCEEIPHSDEFKAAQSALSKAAKELDDALTAEQKVLFNAYKERFFECIDHSCGSQDYCFLRSVHLSVSILWSELYIIHPLLSCDFLRLRRGTSSMCES